MSDGKALIFSAPSGSGKTTIVKYLLQHNNNLAFSISACTRPPRGNHEQDGKDYYFLTVEDFKTRIDNNEFVEWEEVYPGSYYGTLKTEVERIWNDGKSVVFDVDVVGGVNLKKYFDKKALAVFIKVPSLALLEERLNKRGSETAQSLIARLAKAASELEFEPYFDTTLVNISLEESCSNAQLLVDDFLK